MKLKYVELYGFKSFAEKTKLHFDKDISAVVGPNGSGKSNIADAIKWVLGEQSAKSLRGVSMQDVIFSGSDSKKQMNMAQVSLILDNSDKSLPIAFDEVNVTRRVFRTGDSEYLLNKSPVRLKEIRELLLDTGIGKDGYSMIGQGKIDEILSGRNEDRREIFEEATGVSKNKYKKNESEKRLVKNEENLDQVKNELKIKQQEYDILEKQAQNAKEGMKLTSRLELLELNILSNSLDRVSKDLVNDQSKLDLIKIELSDQENELNKLTAKLSPVNENIHSKEELLNDLISQKEKTKEKYNSYLNEKNILEEKVKFYASDIDRLLIAISSNGERLDKIKSLSKDKRLELSKAVESKKSLELEIKNNKDKINKLNEKITLDANKHTSEEKNIHTNKNRLANLQVDKNTKDKLDDSNQKLRENYLLEINNLEVVLADKDARILELEKSITNIDKNIHENSSNLDKYIDARNDKLSQKDKFEKEIANISNELLRLESKRDILERQYNSYDGFYKSVQNLLKISDRNKDISNKIVGVLADLVEIDEKYKTALDLCLGSSLQNIVINNDQDGKYLINFIKQNNIGRITFLPINKIQGYKKDIKHPRAIDTLNNLVKNPKEIDGIIDHFLSKTILVESIDDALVVSNDIKGYRVVTLDGEIINSWGSMVGGSSFKKENTSLLNRKKEIDDLLNEIGSRKKLIEKTTIEKENIVSQLEEIIYNLQVIDKNNSEYSLEKNKYLSVLHEVKVDRSFNEKRRSEFLKLIEDIDKELVDQDFSDISTLKVEIEKVESELILLSNSIKEDREQLARLEKELVKKQADFDVTVRDLSILENDLSNSDEEISDISKTFASDKEILSMTFKNKDQSDERIALISKELENMESRSQEDYSEIEKLKSELEKLRSDIESDRSRIEILTKNISENDKEKYKLELKITSSQERVSELKRDYTETYSVNEEELEEKLNRLEKVEATRKEVLDIKKRLSDIGYFNYESIEQFNAISEELTFIKGQYEDLIKTRNDILDMIKSIEKDIKEKFSESFVKINQRFGEIFKILFNGGEAELKLDSDDILTAGIEITARPPGKKLKSLALLSGGERALTAVALLFSIFEINPAPFCVLDEIDAALDEANIRRYIEYLESLTDKTQFIIITHRKTTMEMAQVLYGVTMEDEGISKVITLALE